MKPKILSYGEIIFDVIKGKSFLGGAPLNFAWFANQLGGETTLISAVGNDDLGLEAISTINNYGINSHINISNQPTGTATVNSNGRFDITYPAAWSKIEIPELEFPFCDLIYFGTLAQMSTSNRNQIRYLVEKAATHVFLDLNLRYPFYSKDTILDSLKMADIVKVNLEEWQEIKHLFSINEPAALIDHFNLTHFAITMGDQGAMFFSGGQKFQYKPGRITEIDPTGSGDAFSAGLAIGLLCQMPKKEILEESCRTGAAVAGNKGAHMKLPDTVKAQFSI